MEMSLSWYCCATCCSCGSLAIVPSGFMISMRAAAGVSPASLQRSIAASVCPALCSTPLDLA